MLVGFLSSSHSWNLDQSFDGVHGSFPTKKSGQIALLKSKQWQRHYSTNRSPHNTPQESLRVVNRSKFCFIHVSVGSKHVSHVSCVGKLPPKDVLYNNNGFVGRHGWLHHISFDVLDLDLAAEPSILQLISNITGTWPGFVCHLLTEQRKKSFCLLIRSGSQKRSNNDKAFCTIDFKLVYVLGWNKLYSL